MGNIFHGRSIPLIVFSVLSNELTPILTIQAGIHQEVVGYTFGGLGGVLFSLLVFKSFHGSFGMEACITNDEFKTVINYYRVRYPSTQLCTKKSF